MKFYFTRFSFAAIFFAAVAFLYSGNSVNAQGTTCAGALAINAGTHVANGPASGNGASNNCHGSGGTHADWYSFTPSTSGLMHIDACPDIVDTRLSVYTGGCGGLTCHAMNDDCIDGVDFSSFVEDVPVTAGTQYLIEWDDRWSLSTFTWTLALSPLPVDLVKFDGEIIDEGNKLSWMTAAEMGSSHFVVERSADGKNNWKEIGNVPATGNEVEFTKYNFIDPQPLRVSYYRLTAVDFDRTITTSEVIELERKDAGFSLISAYPNPTEKYVRLDFHSDENIDIQISILNIAGQPLKQIQTFAEDGINNYRLDIASMPAGIYMLELNDGQERIIERIVKH